MSNELKRDCPYFISTCTETIRNNDKSCYDTCKVYQNWNNTIDKYSYDIEPFNEEKVLAELEQKETISQRLDHWYNEYYKPLYSRFGLYNVLCELNQDVVSYQNQLKYGADFNLCNRSLLIPEKIFKTYFSSAMNTPEYTYWLLKNNGRIKFEHIKTIDNWDEKINSTLAKEYLEAKLNELEAFEIRAKGLIKTKEISDIWKNYVQPYSNYKEYEKYSEEITFLRIEAGYFKKNCTKNHSRASSLYAEHIYLKNYLQTALDKINTPIQPNKESNTKQINMEQENLISKYEQNFDYTPFDLEKCIEELNSIDNVIDRLNFWIKRYYEPLYLWIIDLDSSLWGDLITYQNRLKYWNHYPTKPTFNSYGGQNLNDFTLCGLFSIPCILYEKHFKGFETNEFNFLIFKYEAKIRFGFRIKIDKWDEQIKAPNAELLIKAKLNELDKFRERTNNLLLDGTIFPYKNYNTLQNEYFKFAKEIELVRIEAEYYKTNEIPSYAKENLLTAYANHIYLKKYLETELDKIKNPMKSEPELIEKGNEQEQENNFTRSTIEDYLFEFKEKINAKDYNTLILALMQYFDNGTFPTIEQKIKVSKINKKKFGWTLYQLYAKGFEKEVLTKEYLLFAKQNISLFQNTKFDENDILNSNLYKYFTTKTK